MTNTVCVVCVLKCVVCGVWCVVYSVLCALLGVRCVLLSVRCTVRRVCRVYATARYIEFALKKSTCILRALFQDLRKRVNFYQQM